MPTKMFFDDVYWRSGEDTTTALLESLPDNIKKIERFVKHEDDHLLRELSDEWRLKFVTDCNVGEVTGTQSLTATRVALEQVKARRHPERYTVNLSKAANYIFGDLIVTTDLPHNFTTQFARKINRMIGRGIFDGAGKYRTYDSEPAANGWPPAAQIQQEMEDLFRSTRRMQRAGKVEWYEVGAEFFAKFLYLRPFPNGNGLTARLLLSALLAKKTILPMTLFIDSRSFKMKEVLWKCLVEAHKEDNLCWLRTLVIEGVCQGAEFAATIIDALVEEDDDNNDDVCSSDDSQTEDCCYVHNGNYICR